MKKYKYAIVSTRGLYLAKHDWSSYFIWQKEPFYYDTREQVESMMDGLSDYASIWEVES